mgnify:CR=1 FL=1
MEITLPLTCIIPVRWEWCLRAVLNGIPSIGFSLCNHAPDADFEAAGPYIRSIAAMILEKGLPPLTCLNVNFPDTADIKGVKICEQAKGRWTNEWAACPRLNDPNYFWLTVNLPIMNLKTRRTIIGLWQMAMLLSPQLRLT